MEQGHLSEYIKPASKKADQGKEVGEEVAVVQANRPMDGVIESIHGIANRSTTTKNHLRARLTSAQFWSQAHPIVEFISVLAPPKRDRGNKLIYELTVTEEDLEGAYTPYNNALALMVNICNFDIKRVLTDHGGSSEVVYLNLYNQL